jgi:hypothetical protein
MSCVRVSYVRFRTDGVQRDAQLIAAYEEGEQTMNHEPITRVDIIRRLSLLLAFGLVAQWIGKWFQFWTP